MDQIIKFWKYLMKWTYLIETYHNCWAVKRPKDFFASLMISVTVQWVYQIFFAALWVHHQVLKSLITKITPSNHEYTNRYIKWSIKSFAKKLTFSVHKKKLCSATQKNHYFRKLPIIFYGTKLSFIWHLSSNLTSFHKR